MSKSNKSRRIRIRIISTFITALLLFSISIAVVNYTYDTAKKSGYENLHIQTKEIKEDLELQLISDTENLQTMANFAAKLHANGESMDIMLKSFKTIGLIEEVGVLFPDNSLVTRTGTFPVTSEVSFDEEVKKAPYISGLVNDLTVENRKIVRNCVPIIVEGEVVGILYGVINPQTLEKRLLKNSSLKAAQIFIVERNTGIFIVNTISDDVDNFSILETREFVDGHSYNKLREEVLAEKDGFSAFISQVMTDTTLYLHYAPLSIGDWQIMLAEPEYNVFAEAAATGRIMVMLFMLIVIIVAGYVLLMFSGERKDGNLNRCASKIRKILLGINRQESGIMVALENVVSFAKSRSAFFVNSDGDDYNHIISSAKDIAAKGDDKDFLISKLINYVQQAHTEKGINVTVNKIVANKALETESPELYRLMKKAYIHSIAFSGIISRSNHISVLGCINPKKMASALILLEDISVCFSMAIYNKKYLTKTETVASTDSLTGLYNRMAYKTDLLKYDEKHSENFSCIYIDVNELHVINNTYGHATGDGMLLYIANTLREIFKKSVIYRIGGDEFLVFTEDVPAEEIKEGIKELTEKTEKMNYHVSVGMDFRAKNTDTEELVGCAEKRMYEDKARYYQSKDNIEIKVNESSSVDKLSTGIKEFDALLSILSNRYHGIYCVSLDSGKARRILMPAYLNKFSEDETSFKDAFMYYVHEMVHPDHQRAMLSFLNYDVIKQQLNSGVIPAIEYVKANGEKVVLSVYGLSDGVVNNPETLWIFENIG